MKIETSVPDQNYSVWGFAGTLVWGVLIAIVFVMTQVVVSIVLIGVKYGDVASSEYERLITDIQNDGMVLSLCTIASFIVCSSMIFGVVKLKRNSCIKQTLGLKEVSLGSVKFWLLVTIVFITISDSLTLLLDRPIVPEFMSSVYATTEPTLVLWFAVIIAAPISEELFFRGFIMTGLSATFLRPIGAVLVSSALWAAIHSQYDLYGILTIFVSGLIFGIARLKSGSVLLTIGMHSFMNLVATIEAAIHAS